MSKRILISSGHSNADPGAVSSDRRYREADLAMNLRNLTASSLRILGADVITDGRASVNLPLRDAISLAKANPNGLNIEIHFNAGPPTAAGVECLAHERHKALSQSLCAAIAKHTKSPIRGDKGWKPANSGQHHRLGFCDAGGVILEVEFISNVAALTRYLLAERQIAQTLAKVIYDLSEPLPPEVL